MNEKRKLELDAKLELKDYLRANYWYLLHRPWFWLIAAIATFNLIIFVTRTIQNPSDNVWMALILPGLVVILLINVYTGAKRSLASHKSLQEDIHYTFSDGGVDAVARSSSGHTDWDNFLNASETKHNFLLFISRNQMFTIPKRCFNGKEQIQTLKDILHDNLGTKAKSR
jgi:hypothetical protein